MLIYLKNVDLFESLLQKILNDSQFDLFDYLHCNWENMIPLALH